MPAALPRPRLLKLSGEALAARDGILDWQTIERVCAELLSGLTRGPLAVVVGGGNIMRGAEMRGRNAGDPTRGDYMGMLATLINSLALKEGIERQGGRCEVVGPHHIPNVCHQYHRAQVMTWLTSGTVVVFGGGTGHPFFTTDTTAALRAAEIGASELLKGSKVDGIYTADPKKVTDAKRFDFLTFDQAVEGRYAVMDATAFPICRDHRITIRVFDMTTPETIAAALGPNPPGTLVGEQQL
ncbi:MAG TPA: uridine monophosphate kinase [Planctomycetota bacterium]|nr:uridine monophosphate kinase [Planctomycetota bacterium]